MKSVFLFLLLVLALFLTTSFKLSDEFLITENSIGELNVCQSFESIDLPFLTDTSSGSNGMLFRGKFYGSPGAKILVDTPFTQPSEQKIISRLTTTSRSYKTHDSISVGTSLNELLSKRPEIWLAFDSGECFAIYLEERFSKTRIKYCLDLSSEQELEQLPLGNRFKHFVDVEGANDLLKKIGNIAVIREISLIRTGRCEK